MRKSLLIIIFMSIVSFGYAQPVFSPLAGPPGGNILLIERTSTDKLFALTTQALYESNNSGNTWAKNTAIESVATNLANEGITSLYIDNADKIYLATMGMIYTSIDGGVTWLATTPSGVYSPSKRLLKNETTGSLYVIGHNGSFQGLQRSTDDGLTWFDVSPIANQINDFVIKNTVSFSHIYAGVITGGDAIYKSVNDAGSWAVTNTVLPASTLPNSTSTDANPSMAVNKFSGHVYILLHASQGVYVTTNDGGDWVDVNASSAITFADGSQYGLYTSQESNRVFVKYGNDLFRSDNAITGGASWSQFTLNNTDPPETILSYSSNIFAGLRNGFRNADGILRSTNGGAAWSYADKGINEYETGSFVRADDGRLIVVNGGSTITSSTDEGVSWSKAKQCDCAFFTLIKRSNGNIVAIGDRTYLSTDDGVSWNPLGVAHADFLSRLVSGDGGTTIYGVVGGGLEKIYKSTNGGMNFSELIIPGITGGSQIFGIAADNASNLYAFVENSSNDKVFKIPGPGNTVATEITNTGITQFRGVHTVGANVYILGDVSNVSRLSKSTNQGTSWTFQIIDESAEVVMVSDDLIFSRNFDNEIEYSNNAGVDWDIIFDPNISGAGLANVAIDANGFAYVSMTQGAMYKSSSSVVRPNKPANFKTIGVADNIVYLEWDYDNSGGAIVDAFDVERKLTSGGTFAKVGEAGSSNLYFVDRTTVKNTGYDFRIIAQSAAGSNTSVPISLTTTDDCALTIPDNRSWAGSVDGGAFTLDPISIRKYNSDYYEISDVTAGSLAAVLELPSGPGTYGVTAVTTIFSEACGTPFIERDGDGDIYPSGNGTWNGSTTITLNFQIDKSNYVDTEKTVTLILNGSDPTPEVPQNVSASVLNNTSIQVQWDAGDFQQKYYVERSLTSGSGFSQVSMINYPTLTFTDPGPFIVGTTYFYRVKSENNVAAQSAYSTEASVVFNQPIFVLSSTIVSAVNASAPSAAWADFDNDGFEDLVMPQVDFLGQNPGEPFLFKNNGAGDFQLITGQLPFDFNYVGPTVADYDNDGNLDFFMTAVAIDGGGTSTFNNALMKNDGSFAFTNVTGSIVVPQVMGQSSLSSSWVDVNNNGILDLFIPYEDGNGQKLFAGIAGGTFNEITSAGELITDSFSKGSAFWADYDNDGDMDVFVLSNDDTQPNRLYNNDGVGAFARVMGSVFDADTEEFFSASWGDYNNDQFLDLFVGVDQAPNLLYKNNGDGTFVKVAVAAGSPTESLSDSSFGSAWSDVDNDGDLDLLVVNAGAANYLYLNLGNETFNKITGESIAASNIDFKLGAAFADYDNDGHLDVVVGGLTFPGELFIVPANDPQIRLYKNNVTTGNWTEVKLNGTMSNRAAIGARIKIVAGGKTQIREISSLTGTAGQSSLIAHFGLGAETAITSLQVKWPSGITQNWINPPINQILTITEDATAPQVVGTIPLDNEVDVSVTTNIAIAYDDVPIPVGGKKIILVKQGETTPSVSFDITSGTIVGNDITFPLSSPLDFFTTYNVVVEAGAVTDIYGNATPIAAWSFVTLDNVAPVINFTPVNVDKGFGSLTFEVDITDNSGTVATAKISHRKIGGSTFSDLDGAINGTSGLWDFVIQESLYDDMGAEFSFEAMDAAGNTTRSPTDPTNYYSYLNYKDANAPKFPTTSLVFGGNENTWNIVSIPFDLGTSATVTAVLDELGAFDNTKWRLLTYQNQTSWAEFPSNFSSFERGKGYFINVKTPPNAGITIADDILAPQNNQADLFSINLSQGWNQIGNPYLVPISWADIKAFNSTVTGVGDLKVYNSNGKSYGDGDILSAYQGGFVFSDAAVSDFKISFDNQIAGGRKGSAGRITSTELDNENWRAMFELSQSYVTFTLGGVGMSPEAKLSFDEHDDITMPRLNDFLEINFHHPEYFAKRFSRDVVPTQNEYSWEFTVDSNLQGNATLSWNNELFGLNEKELYLFDVALQKLIDMRTANNYAFDVELSNRFKVYFGENLLATIQPEKILLGKAYPNPASGITTIPFTLPQSSGVFAVRLEVYDMMGRSAAVLQNGLLPSGFYESQWDTSGGQLVDGLYTYRLVVNGDGKNEVFSNKIILNK